MKVKTSAHYQREFRRRLRERGLVKKEVWIHPQHTQLLVAVEKKLREADGSLVLGNLITANLIKGMSADGKLKVERGQRMKENTAVWSTASLYDALVEADPFVHRQASLELIDGIEPSLHIVMHEYGDLPIFLSVCGEQILAESVLWALSDVIDAAGFNESILRTHKYFPLSTVCLDTMADGTDYYMMFGALSSASTLANVLSEIEALASNIIQATEAYGAYLKLDHG